MKVSKPYNATLLSIIARNKEISYMDLKEEYCLPSPPGVILSRNVMYDSDLEMLEAEGHIRRTDDLIIYIRR